MKHGDEMSNSKDNGFGEDVKGILQELEVELDGEGKSGASVGVAGIPGIPGIKAPEPSAATPRLPNERVIVKAAVQQDDPGVEAGEEIVIKAQVSVDEVECKFMLNRPLFPGYSWWFGHPQDAEGSPLVEKLFALDGILSVVVDDSVMVVTRSMGALVDWHELAAQVGTVTREHLQAGGLVVKESLGEGLPSEEELGDKIQKIIDEDINPGVAAHSGHISLERVRGNAVYIRMGGGCQGCSSASLTLRQGIHSVFRSEVFELGAIYDETDHSAGENPYFS